MKTYQITSSAGVDLGTYDSNTVVPAVVAMWRAAGNRGAHVTAEDDTNSGPVALSGRQRGEMLTAEAITVTAAPTGAVDPFIVSIPLPNRARKDRAKTTKARRPAGIAE